MNKITSKWIFNDGTTKMECTSFPYAFRTMYSVAKKVLSEGKSVLGFKIVAPTGRIYSYLAAKQMAEDQGLLKADGEINSREFKR